MEVVRELARDHTVILISHRLANAAEADRIYLLREGRIAEQGTHEELMGPGRRLREAVPDSGGTGAIRKGEKDMKSEPHRRKGIRIMGGLIGLVKPLLPVMFLAVLLGTLGYICAIFLTILAGYGLLRLFFEAGQPGTLFAALGILAVLRGLFHYGEQYCNHFIAFKLLALIRHKVFAALRRLCPAKLEGKDKGNLISMITTDVELLEVFYAHTISPIAIAAAVSLIMTVFIGRFSPLAGILALAAYVTVGAVIPLVCGKRGGEKGLRFRNRFGDLNSFVLDSLRGLDETIQYRRGEQRRKAMERRSEDLGRMQKELNDLETFQRSVTNLAILGFSFGMLFLMVCLRRQGLADGTGMVLAVVAMMGSFGPVSALANLSNNLNQTLASGERVLSLLEEEPQVEDISGRPAAAFEGASAERVDFSYGGEEILKDYCLEIPRGKILGIHGQSGCGKSTLLKLLMRFWDVQGGAVKISGRDIRQVNTGNLRNMEAFMTQETHLFHDSLANNIALAKPGASRQEIRAAAEKASIHEFIESLPKGYDTEVGELGDTLSGGERQRIGLARVFLHGAPFVLLDEPTSNLDSLNEGVILKSLKETKKDQTVILVSHRRSTLNVAELVVEMESGRKS